MIKTERVVIDTNFFLDRPDILETYVNPVFSITVLKELDGLKSKPDVGYSARAAIRNINNFITNNPGKFIFDSTHENTIDNDLNIIFCARRANCKLLTKDISMSLIARSYNVDCEFIDDANTAEFNGYIFDDKPEFPFPTPELTGGELDAFKRYIQSKFNRDIEPWQFYILNKKDVYCYNPKIETLELITKRKEVNKVTVDEGVEFKPLDIYQKMAVYSILNSDATLITGLYGAGKSALAVATAISLAKGKKVMVMRPTIKSTRYDVGFMPGDKSMKLLEFFSGFMSALGFLYGNTRTVCGEKGCGFDYIKEVIAPQKLEFLTMTELHGLSVQKGDIIIIDESQLINKSYMQLLLSRICDGAKLIILGDTNQIYGLLTKAESGLYSLLKNLPHRGMAVVELRNTYRNKELVDLADKILK